LAAPSENLVPKAAISTSSVHGDRFLPEFAVDGVVPSRDSKYAELHRAWCVLKSKTGDRADFTLHWEQPIDVAEIVYYGQTRRRGWTCRGPKPSIA
jgi:hypothetical protein